MAHNNLATNSGDILTSASVNNLLKIESNGNTFISGNFGIGVTDPSSALDRLHVYDASDPTILLDDANSRSLTVEGPTSSRPGFVGTRTTDQLHIGANSLNNITLDTQGRVGIGTNSMSQAFNIVKNLGGAIGGANPSGIGATIINTNSSGGGLFNLLALHQDQTQIDRGPAITFSSLDDNSDRYTTGLIGSAMSSTNSANPDGYLSFSTVKAGTVSEKMKLDADGILKLPNVAAHDMSGEVYKDLLINNIGELGFDSSASRYKTFIGPIGDTTWIYSMSVVEFFYKATDEDRLRLQENESSSTPGELPYILTNSGTTRGEKQEGFIADEISELNPRYVFYNELGEVEGAHYRKFVVPLLAEVQKLRKELDDVKLLIT